MIQLNRALIVRRLASLCVSSDLRSPWRMITYYNNALSYAGRTCVIRSGGRLTAYDTTVKMQTAVTAYFLSKHLLLVAFGCENISIAMTNSSNCFQVSSYCCFSPPMNTGVGRFGSEYDYLVSSIMNL